MPRVIAVELVLEIVALVEGTAAEKTARHRTFLEVHVKAVVNGRRLAAVEFRRRWVGGGRHAEVHEILRRADTAVRVVKLEGLRRGRGRNGESKNGAEQNGAVRRENHGSLAGYALKP